MKLTQIFLGSIKKEISRHRGQHFYASTVEIWAEIEKNLGYGLEELIEHIESQFEPWMSWGNNGKVPSGMTRGVTWQLDHIIPKSSFIYRSFSDEDFKKCWSLDNLQVLDSVENLEKAFREKVWKENAYEKINKIKIKKDRL